MLLRLPPSFTMEQGATIGVGLLTNIMALWDPSALALTANPDAPAEKPMPVLVYGGSTATGTLATQILRLSGLHPIVTCSPHSFDLVKSRGAVDAIDYAHADAGDQIKQRTGGKLRHAYDCITDTASTTHCYAAIGRTGGRYASLELVPEELRTRKAVVAKAVLGYEAFGRDVALSRGYESVGDEAKNQLAIKYLRVFQRLLDDGLIKPHPTHMLGNGWEAVMEGMKILKEGSMSGKKMVALV
jgi:NADPH:quinone reductase-like Zn-dependent oxidoreductase